MVIGTLTLMIFGIGFVVADVLENNKNNNETENIYIKDNIDSNEPETEESKLETDFE